jgi:hypothetical protein
MTSLLSNRVLTVGLLGPAEIVPDRLGRVPDWFFGVLEAEFGLWYAYVMKRARDRKTSAVMVHFTRLVRASIKDGNTSCVKVSALRASKNRFTIPTSS